MRSGVCRADLAPFSTGRPGVAIEAQAPASRLCPGAVDAVRRLTALAGEGADLRLRLQALEALHYLPLHPEVSRPLARRLAEDEDEYLRGAAGYLELRLDGSYRPDSSVFRFDLFKSTGHTGLPTASPRVEPAAPRR